MYKGRKATLIYANSLQEAEIERTTVYGLHGRGTHARGVYPTQDTSRMGTVKMKYEKEKFFCSSII